MLMYNSIVVLHSEFHNLTIMHSVFICVFKCKMMKLVHTKTNFYWQLGHVSKYVNCNCPREGILWRWLPGESTAAKVMSWSKMKELYASGGLLNGNWTLCKYTTIGFWCVTSWLRYLQIYPSPTVNCQHYLSPGLNIKYIIVIFLDPFESSKWTKTV